MRKLKIGIVGFGNIGHHHYEMIRKGVIPNMELTAVCDINPQKLEYAQELMPGIPCFEKAEDLFKSGLVEAVIISTPHYFHPSLAIKAFEYGLHVVSEKPAGVYTRQVNEMIAAAQRSGKVLAVNFCLRGMPVYQTLRNMVKSGELGHIKRITWIATQWYRPQAYHDSAGWRSSWATEGGGVLINQCPHQLDLLQWIFGCPDEILSDISFGKYHDIEVDDEVSALFRYKNGTIGAFLTGTSETPGTNRLEISCDMGRVVLENGKITFDKLEENERAWNNALKSGQPPVNTVEVPLVEGEAHLSHVFIDFANAVLEGKKACSLSPGADSIHEALIANALYYSAWKGNVWVNLNNFPHDDFYDELMKRVATSKPKEGVDDRFYVTGGTSV